MRAMFRSLRNRNYRYFAAGSLVANVGTWLQRVAQDWLVLQLTAGSGVALGITTGLQFLPFLLLAPFGGTAAEQFEPAPGSAMGTEPPMAFRRAADSQGAPR